MVVTRGKWFAFEHFLWKLLVVPGMNFGSRWSFDYRHGVIVHRWSNTGVLVHRVVTVWLLLALA